MSAILRLRTVGGESVLASGYFLDVLAFEHPTAYDTPRLTVQRDEPRLGLSPKLLQDLRRSDTVLLEIDGRTEDNAVLTSMILGTVERVGLEAHLWDCLPTFESVSLGTRKRPELPGVLRGFELVDLEAVTLPGFAARPGAHLAFASRRARVLIGEKLCVVLWEEPRREDALNWNGAEVRRHGIPGSSGLVPLVEGEGRGGMGAALAVAIRIAEHNRYFLQNARAAIEIAESQYFRTIAGSNVSSAQDLLDSLDNLANLERFLALARTASARLRRRLEVSSLGKLARATAEPAGSGTLDGTGTVYTLATDVAAAVSEARDELRAALLVVSASATVASLRHQIEEDQRAVRFRNLVSVAAVAFSLVSVFLAVYGANVRELAPGAAGDLAQLALGIAVILLSVGVVGLLAMLAQRRRRRRAVAAALKYQRP